MMALDVNEISAEWPIQNGIRTAVLVFAVIDAPTYILIPERPECAFE
jgi:hypothetical protein